MFIYEVVRNIVGAFGLGFFVSVSAKGMTEEEELTFLLLLSLLFLLVPLLLLDPSPVG